MKRCFDFFTAAFLLIILSPVICFASIIIRLTLGSPVLFKQRRPGFNEIPFYIYKFRSMTDDRDEQGKLLPDEQRLTILGKWIRKSSIDELPQLFNVLKGELSLVGPRPLLMEYIPLYSAEQRRRHEVRPGITGWAQVNGRNTISWEDKFKFDIWYVDNRSFLLDLKIIVLTVLKVFKSEGIHQQGHATIQRFKGTSI